MSEPILTITSHEDAVELILTQEGVRMRLSENILRQFRDEVAADPDVQAPGWIGRFARAVTGAAGHLLKSYIEYTLDDIDSLVYEGGALVFTYRKRHLPSFEDVKISDDGANMSVLASFAPADAQNFVERFNTLKAQARR